MTTQMESTKPEYRTVRPVEPEPTGWVGWIVFAGVMLALIGVFQGIAGLVALLNDSYYLVPSSNLVVSVDYTAWGWVHLAFGVVALFAAYGVTTGRMWARIFGITVAFLSAIVNLAFIGAYPVMALVVIAIDVFVIYALAVHGSEAKHA